jgi:futalosine hydrolase
MFATEMEAGPFRQLGADAEVIVSGVGQVNAARALTALYESGYAGPVILGGCAGAYAESGLAVGDVALATEEIYADLGAFVPDGWLDLSGMGISLMEVDGNHYAERLPLPASTRAIACLIDSTAAAGPFVTVSAGSGTRERGDGLRQRYGALCENMEGAAAAQVALHYGTDLIEVRGISNMVVDRDRESWDIPLASLRCAEVMAELVRRSGEWT